MRRKVYLILAIILIPLWIIGAAGEIRDSYLVKHEGRVTTGTILSTKYYGGRGPHYRSSISYTVDGREYRKYFKISARQAAPYINSDDVIYNPSIEVVYAPSRPQAVELVMDPSDPVWVSVLLACVGLGVVTGIFLFLAFTARK